MQAGQSLVIENDLIVESGPANKFNPKDFDYFYDASLRGGTVITPGFINTHAHPPMYLMRSAMMLDEGEGVDEAIAAMPRWERAMNENDYTIATIGDITEQQKYGISTTLSHYGVFDPIEKATTLTGHNTINALSVISNSHPENSPALIKELMAKAANFRSTPAMALHYLYKASGADLEAIKKLSSEYNLLFTCHLAESAEVAKKCVAKHGLGEVDVLEKYGLLNENTVLSHVIHVNDADIKKLAAGRVGISHLPTSNVIHKSGTFQFWKFDEAQAFAYLTLGTDGVVSKSRMDILSEAYQTRITHLYNRTVKFGSLFKIITANGARVLRMPDRGKLLPGYKADLAFWKIKDRGFIPYDENNPVTLLGNLITHGGRAVRDLMINGQFAIKDRRHALVNESQLLADIQNAHMEMRARLK